MEKLLITIVVVLNLAAVTPMVVFLLLGFTVLYILRWLVWLLGVLLKICWYLIVLMFLVAFLFNEIVQGGRLQMQ